MFSAVPLNPNYPDAVLEYIFKDSEVVLAITTPEHVEKLRVVTHRAKIELLVLDTDVTYVLKVIAYIYIGMIKSLNTYI